MGRGGSAVPGPSFIVVGEGGRKGRKREGRGKRKKLGRTGPFAQFLNISKSGREKKTWGGGGERGGKA